MVRQILENKIADILKSLGISEPKVVLEHPGDMVNGDYSTNVALAYAKELKLKPSVLAEKIGEGLKQAHLSEVSKIEIAGPGFINFYLSEVVLKKAIEESVDANTFGTSLQKGEKWVIEYASPNPNKAMHLGHLRNVITGVAICNLLEANGAQVYREMVDNNRGIALAKLMWGYLKYARKDGVAGVEQCTPDYWMGHLSEWNTPETAGKKPDRFVDELYVLGSGDCKDEQVDAQVRNLVVCWEAGDRAVRVLWKQLLSYAYAGQKITLDRLGARFDTVWHEDEHYEKGKDYVAQGLEKGIFKKLEDGAILTNLAEYQLTDTVVEKKDGTALYITQDIALTKRKKDFYKDVGHFVWIIGPEQSLAMQQMFAVCEQLGIGKRSEFVHLPYGYVSLKGKGKMSSREGTVVFIDDVIDEAKKEVKEKMQNREYGTDTDIIAEQVALGAVKFSLLRAGRTSDTSFDMVTALDLQGDTGPYIQYTAVRAGAVLEKAKQVGIEPKSSNGGFGAGETLARMITRYPDIVERAGRDFAPHLIALFALELAGAFNSFYAVEQIIIEGDPASAQKVLLTQAVREVLIHALGLLGIQVPKRM